MTRPAPTWTIGLTTVPGRKYDLLPRTLASLKAAGWNRVRLFVDGCGPAEAKEYEDRHGQEVTAREPRIRAFGNFVLGLAELYVRNPVADRYMMVQDDVEVYRNLRAYLDRQPFPKQGYWNLYSAFENEAEVAPVLASGKTGWTEGTVMRSKDGKTEHPRRLQRGRGALALVFDREGVIRVLSYMGTIQKPAHADRGYRLIDGAVVTAMNEQGWREWVHAPTLANHLGLRSSIERSTGQPHYPPARTWRGAGYDALEMLKCLAT